MGFREAKDGVYCEKLRVKDIQQRVPESPFYLYSLQQITDNYTAYEQAFAERAAIVAYAVKANSNLFILRELQRLGAGAVLVSGNELRLAREAGFNPNRTILNGNGKTHDELVLAAEHGVRVNIDSEFDLRNIARAATETGRAIDVLIRINPDIDPNVHPYVSTGMRSSKFGIRSERLMWFLDRIRKEKRLNLVGIHCHIGSTIANLAVFGDAASLMMEAFDLVRGNGFDIEYVNLGGGLGIDYGRDGGAPDPTELVAAVRDHLRDDITVIVEPGRSIVGNAGVLVGRVIGTKSNGPKSFIVTDASMSELLRPSLYGAYHHVGFVEPVAGTSKPYDVVGPVCESADYLAQGRAEGTGIVVYDTGAYGYAMSSNYNARRRPPEYLVDGDRLILIRRAETIEDQLALFDTGEDPVS